MTCRLLTMLGAVLALIGMAATASAADAPDFGRWLDDLRTEAIASGISASVVERALTGVEPVRRVVERDRSQAEFTLTFRTYRDRLLTPANIAAGQKKAREFSDVLQRVADTYHVQPRFILAIWGMETRYGAIRPTMPVVPALVTLAFDRRRSDYFRREVFQALRMVDNGHIELEHMTGSWAGAMGQPQFMPSSYMAYARDFDGDGRRDIWDSEADVFASIANYLARHGWSDDQTWGREVRLPAGKAFRDVIPARKPGSGCRAIDAMSDSQPLSAWQAAGVRRTDGADLPGRDLQASLVEPDGAGGPAFLVYRNYHSILRYNCAHLYGLAVSQLADALDDR
ncbi:MAG: lytic murein transglycosylase [Pseudomonadota bacterium]|nr:lytic murein transglycosylase [Pseudomonadota bacterium]